MDIISRRCTRIHTAQKQVVGCGCWILARDHEFVKQHEELILSLRCQCHKDMERMEDGEMSLRWYMAKEEVELNLLEIRKLEEPLVCQQFPRPELGS